MKFTSLFLTMLAVLAAGCSSLMLKPADFSWPIEDELKVDSHGMVHEERYTFSFNVKPLFYEETKDSVNITNKTIRIIRDVNGYFFLTAPKFKNVYVFSQAEGALELQKTIPVSQTGLSSPGFNQRTPYVELINGNDKPIMLTKDGIKEEEKK